MRSKADETFVTVETLICPLQISHLTQNIKSLASAISFSSFKLTPYPLSYTINSIFCFLTAASINRFDSGVKLVF